MAANTHQPAALAPAGNIGSKITDVLNYLSKNLGGYKIHISFVNHKTGSPLPLQNPIKYIHIMQGPGDT